MIPFWERDLSAVFSTADFAVSASLADGTTILGVFEQGEFETTTDMGRQVVRSEAVFITRARHNVSDSDELEIDGIVYRVRFTIGDGAGTVKLYLERLRESDFSSGFSYGFD